MTQHGESTIYRCSSMIMTQNDSTRAWLCHIMVVLKHGSAPIWQYSLVSALQRGSDLREAVYTSVGELIKINYKISSGERVSIFSILDSIDFPAGLHGRFFRGEICLVLSS